MTRSAFSDFEHQAWETVVEDYDAAFSRLTQQVIPAMLDALELAPGMRLLDVACGTGYLAAAAAARGTVTEGVDFSVPMVMRARSLHPGIDFHEGDALTLDGQANGSFDAVGMNFGILHFDEPERALSAMHRVLRPGGRLAFTAWGPPEMVAGFAIPMAAIQRSGNPNVGLPPGPPFFHFSDAANCEEALKRCGFREMRTAIVPQHWVFPSPGAYFEALLHGTARTGGALKRQSPAELAAVRADIERSVAPFMSGGELHLPMPAHLVWATKAQAA